MTNCRSGFELTLWFCGACVLLFVIAPLAGMALHCTWPGLVQTVQDPEVRRSIRLTLLVSLGGTAVFSLVAVPFAWILARREFRSKELLVAIIDLPVVLPPSTAGIALLSIINRDSALGHLADRFGFSLVSHPVGIAMAMAFLSLPFLINAARDGFAAVPVRLEKTAMTLGASPLRVFFTISLPLARRSILTGFVMMFARGLSSFGAVIVVAYHPMIMPVLIYERFAVFGLSHAMGPAVVFLLVTLVMIVVFRLLSGGRCHVER